MRGAMPQLPEPPVAGRLPWFHDVVQVVGKGSPAMTLEELPWLLVGALPRYALLVLAQVLQALLEGVPSRLLMVLHLCLAKKEPAWLVRNSRPVMLEPYLRHLKTGMVEERRMSHRKRQWAVPPKLFAYRHQLSGQMLALTCQWLLAGWVLRYGAVWSDNWGKANVFCNPNRSGRDALDHQAPEESPSPWLLCFYDTMEVWVASPYSLAGPYYLAHGGAQGDNMGVGCFTKVSEKRTEYLWYVVCHTLHPEARCTSGPQPISYVLQQPAWPHRVLPEVGFSDDCHHFALSGWGLALLMACAATCGSPQVRKLKVHSLLLGRRCI